MHYAQQMERSATPGYGVGGLRGMAMRLYAYMAHAYHCHRAERDLAEASDDMLRDLGITRSEIASVVWYGAEGGARRRPTGLGRDSGAAPQLQLTAGR